MSQPKFTRRVWSLLLDILRDELSPETREDIVGPSRFASKRDGVIGSPTTNRTSAHGEAAIPGSEVTTGDLITYRPLTEQHRTTFDFNWTGMTAWHEGCSITQQDASSASVHRAASFLNASDFEHQRQVASCDTTAHNTAEGQAPLPMAVDDKHFQARIATSAWLAESSLEVLTSYPSSCSRRMP